MEQEGLKLPTQPVLRIHLDDLNHEANHHFLSLVDCARVLSNAISNVLRYLYVPHGSHNIPSVRSVTLILRPMGGVAYTTGLALDDLHKEIHLSLDYICNYIKDPARFRDETIGVITHEMVHAFQHNCHGAAPGGLIEGMADFVRLKAGLAPPHWKKIPEERGKKWDEGYQKTAWFLEWLEETHGEGTVSRMNDTMKGHYDEKQFWHGLFEQDVISLWNKYKASWMDEQADGVISQPPSTAGTEPEVVELTDMEKIEADMEVEEQVTNQLKKPREFRA